MSQPLSTHASTNFPATAEAVFKAWALERAAQRTGALSPRSLASYHSLWVGWNEYLLGHKSLAWHEAGSNDVRAYLEALNPRAQARGLLHVSTVTQRRYYRVLKKIYTFAVAQQWLADNPVDAAASVSPTEQMDSLVFHSIDWDALVQAVAPPQDPPPSDQPWLEVRDQAILRLMMQSALTVAELAGLDFGDVQHPRLGMAHGVVELWPAGESPAGEVPPGAQAPVTLDLNGARQAQARRISLPPEVSCAVLAWLTVRATLPLAQDADVPLFISRKKAGRLTPRALFHLANRHINAVLGPRYPGTVLAHAGPMTLRNSCMVRWLDAGVSDDEVLARAGLREPQALLRLRKHVHAAALDDTASTSPPA
ncbi:MAG: tyrosine-type recombinase/integrase [Polaromonas sp.]